MADKLSIKDYDLFLTKAGQRLPVITRADLNIGEGEIVGLIGESGCGKTVLWKSVFGLLDPDTWDMTGTVTFQGQKLDPRDTETLLRIRGRDVAVILQDAMSSFDQIFTIEQHFLETARAHSSWSREETIAKAKELLTRMYIKDPDKVLKLYPFQCSGGMLQRIMIAIALLLEPAVLIADEPTTAVDVTVQREILAMLRELNRERGTSILYISHDLRSVEALADRIYVMYAGYLVESFPAELLRKREAEHPYTQKLLQSRPSYTKDRLPVMKGNPPALAERPAGCPFSPRCVEVGPECECFDMHQTAIGAEHFVRCWRKEADA